MTRFEAILTAPVRALQALYLALITAAELHFDSLTTNRTN